MRHSRLQYRLVELLRPFVGEGERGVVAAEVPFRALPEYELSGADVAFVSRQRWDGATEDDNLYGSPELVIKVLPPTETKRERREKSSLCLTTGCEEVWIVHPVRKSVTVIGRMGQTRTYEPGEVLPLQLFGAALAAEEVTG